jgi:hypothetical protein
VDKTHTADLTLAGLRIRVHGRQLPDAQDPWDGNWLSVTARCEDAGASIVVSGPILHLSELVGWCGEIEKLLATLAGEARLACIEPNLSVVLKATSLGHITLDVSITSDHLTQKHWFQFNIDQSYLPPLIAGCRSILQAYPLRGEQTA